MPLVLSEGLPVLAELKAEGAPVADHCPAGVRPLHIGLLNLMPLKERTESDFARMLAREDLWVQLTLVKFAGQVYRHTPQEHVERFYWDFDDPVCRSRIADGLVVTGAPVEQMPFEDVRYWPQLCAAMDWARRNVRSTLYICWGAQAALYHFYGIAKHPLPEKCFGIFPQQLAETEVPLLKGLENGFLMPHSRHTEIRQQDVDAVKGLRTLVRGEKSGVGIVTTEVGNEVFVTGHLEYAPDTLHMEYMRDKSQGKPIHIPENYYVDDNPEAGVDYSWEAGARTFYRNWLDSCAADRAAV